MQSIGEIMMAIGVVGAFIIPDFIAGVTKAQRMGRASYPKGQKKKKWMWVGIFLLIAAVGAGMYFLFPADAKAEGATPDVPVITWKGTEYAVVLYTSDTEYIHEQFPGTSISAEKKYRMVRFQAVGESAYSKPKEAPFMDCVLVSAGGRRLYPDFGKSTDETPPRTELLFVSKSTDEEEYSLEMNGQVYSLENVPDMDTYSPDLFTPSPTATPVPTPTPDPVTVRLENVLSAFRERSHMVLTEMPELEGKVFIVIYYYGMIETSEDAARKGDAFHGVPAEFLAPAYEEADTVLLVYEVSKQVGHYSTGGGAFRVDTDVAVIHGKDEQMVRIVSNEPPQTIRGSIGASGSGDYEPETAMEKIVEKLMEKGVE